MKLLDKIKEKRKKRIEKRFTNYVDKLKKDNKLNVKDLLVLNYKNEVAFSKMTIICTLLSVILFFVVF